MCTSIAAADCYIVQLDLLYYSNMIVTKYIYWEEDDILNKLFFFHRGVRANLAPDVPGVMGELGGLVWLPVVNVGDGGLPETPVAPSAPSSRCTSSVP